MSSTKRSILVRPMFVANFQYAFPAARVLLALAVIMAIAWPASAVTVYWKGGGSDNLWSTGANWTPSNPLTVDDVIFNNTASVSTAGSITNIVSADRTINTLSYNNLHQRREIRKPLGLTPGSL